MSNSKLSRLIDTKNLLFTQGEPKWAFQKFTLLYMMDVKRHSTYKNVQLFIRSKTGLLYFATFKYYLRESRETILR